LLPIVLGQTLDPGQRHKNVPALRVRLKVRPQTADDFLYDDRLAVAVIKFQKQSGLQPDGIIGPTTLKLLNVTHIQKMLQIIANLERLRWVGDERPGRFVMVNIPAATLWAIEDGRVSFEMPVIVGKLGRETPAFITDITGVRFNPGWTVPPTIKREDIVQAAFFGRGRPLEGVPIVEGTPWWDAELSKGWRYDPAEAKRLLAAAGAPNGFQTVMLATAQFGMHKDTAEVVQQHLAAIGIQCELRLPDWSTRVRLGTTGQYEIAIHGVSADNNDPDGLTVIMDTSLSPTHGRSFGVQAPRTIDLLARGRAEFDETRRVAIYKDMQRAALEEVPLVGLAWRAQGYGMDRRVTGFTNIPGALSTSSGFMLTETTIA
jgi:hypothetical protein